MSTTSPVPVLQGDKGLELRSQGDSLLLRRPDEEVRIPLAAIALIHAEGRVVAVELTAPAGVESTLYRIEDVSRAAGRAFADAVNAALPEPAEGEEAVDGSTLVTVRRLRPAETDDEDEEDDEGYEEAEHRGHFYRWAVRVVGVALVALAVAVGVAGGHGDRAIAVLLVGAVGALLALGAVGALETAWENWYLPRHGITVDAQSQWLGGRDRYAYMDVSGRTRLFAGPKPKDGEPVRIAYNPRRPGRAVRCEGWERQVKDLLLAVVVLALAAPVVYGAIALALPAFDR